MCGIAATVDVDEAAVFARLFAPLRHRGPDESRAIDAGRARLGCHRLAIVDAAGGRPPLPSSDGGRLPRFHGGIYKHRALRDEFRGYRFRTETDGEVIFPVVAAEGPQGLRRLRGMFAFVLVDLARGGFLAGRGPPGST